MEIGWVEKFRKLGKWWQPRFSEAAAVLDELIEERMTEEDVIESLDAISYLISYSLHFEMLQSSAARAAIAVRHYLPLTPTADLRDLQSALATEIKYLTGEPKDAKRDIEVRKAYLLVCMTLRQPNLAKDEIRALEEYILRGESVGHVMEAFFDVFNVWLYDHDRVIGQDWYGILERAVQNVGDDVLLARTYHILATWATQRHDVAHILHYASQLYSIARLIQNDIFMFVAASYLSWAYQVSGKLVMSAFWVARVQQGADKMHPAVGIQIEAGHLLMADHFEAAASLYRHALQQLNAERLNPMFSHNIPYIEARILLDLGYTLVWLERYEEAEEKLSRALEINRQHHNQGLVAEVLYRRGILLAHQYKRDEALWALSEAAEQCYGLEDPNYQTRLLSQIKDTRSRIEERGEIGPELHATKRSSR